MRKRNKKNTPLKHDAARVLGFSFLREV